MTDDSLARNLAAAPPGVDAAYDAIHATIVASERGRWFLDQHAIRYRGADADAVLAALARIEQAISGGSPSEPAEALRQELATIVEALGQARADLIGQHGDPAASGEAALAEFANAAGQIQELVLAAQQQDAGLELGSQLSFQINRLAGAGERLERSMGALREALGLLEEVDQGLRQLAHKPGPAVAAAAQPSPPAEAPRAAPPPEPADDLLVRAIPDEPPARPDMARAEPLWDLTVAPSEPVPDELAAAAEPALQAMVSDWAFAPAAPEPEPEPAPRIGHPLPPVDIVSAPEPAPAEPPMSALDRLEAREYGRRLVATATMPPAPEPAVTQAPPAEPADRPDTGGFDDLLLGAGPASDAEPMHASLAEEWTIAPAPAIPAPEPLFDADLFDTEGRGDAAAAPGPRATAAAPEDTSLLIAADAPEPVTAHDLPQAWDTPLPAMPVEPDPQPAFEPEPDFAASAQDFAASAPQPEQQPDADMPSVLQRLESMRTAIAALMDEVSEKTARRTPPR